MVYEPGGEGSEEMLRAIKGGGESRNKKGKGEANGVSTSSAGVVRPKGSTSDGDGTASGRM